MSRDKLPDFPDLSVPIGEQVENLIRWNTDLDLGFSREDFEPIEDEDSWPSLPTSPLEVVVVYSCLDSPYATWITWLKILGLDFENRVMPEKEDDIRIISGSSYQRGFFIGIIDLGAHWSRDYTVNEISPASVMSARPLFCPHFGVLAAAAQLPLWVKSMGKPLPYAFAAGIQIKPHLCHWETRYIYVPFLCITKSREGSWISRLSIDVAPQQVEWSSTYAIPEFITVTSL